MSFRIVYRGPLQRSRLSLLLAASARAFGEGSFAWITPWPIDRGQVGRLSDFLETTDGVRAWEIIDGHVSVARRARQHLKRFGGDWQGPTLCVGFSSLPYAARLSKGPLIWCINGIPEERLLHNRSVASRIRVRMQWLMPRLFPVPTLIVTVSSRMARLVADRVRSTEIVAIPNAPDPSFFQPDDGNTRRLHSYMGSGAPWQGVEHLSDVWGEVHEQDPTTRFRVISRDERTRVLARHLPDRAVEFTAAEHPADVARLLHNSGCGYLLRSPDLVNRVSFPLKFGEYVSTGTWVVSSDIDWDPGDLVRETRCGILTPASATPREIAARVLEAQRSSDELIANCARASARLDWNSCVEDLTRTLLAANT